MALPKRRHSKTRGKKRRTHWKASSHSVSRCPQCNQTKLPHRVCPNCGYYKGQPILSPKAA